MIKAILSWLRGILGVSAPAIFSISGRLTGVEDGYNDISTDASFTIEDLELRLSQAGKLLTAGSIDKARSALEQADLISAQVNAYAPEYEGLMEVKASLWEALTMQELEEPE